MNLFKQLFFCSLLIGAPLAGEEPLCTPEKVTEALQKIAEPIFEEEGMEARFECREIELFNQKQFKINPLFEIKSLYSKFKGEIVMQSIDDDSSRFNLTLSLAFQDPKQKSSTFLLDMLSLPKTKEEFDVLVECAFKPLLDEKGIQLSVDSWGDGSPESLYALTAECPERAFKDLEEFSCIERVSLKVEIRAEEVAAYLDGVYKRKCPGSQEFERDLYDSYSALCSGNEEKRLEFENQLKRLAELLHMMDSWIEEQRDGKEDLEES